MADSLKIIKKRLSERGVASIIAKRSGLKNSVVSAYKNGQREPGITQVDKMAAALGMTTAEFLTDPDGEPAEKPLTHREQIVYETLIELIERLKREGLHD